MTSNKAFKIDIEAVIASKNPRLLKILPKFIIKYIKRIIHQDEMNEVLLKHNDKSGLEFVDAALADFNIKVKINGEENIPKEGKYIFVANHPLGGVESVAMMQVIGKYLPNLRFLVNDVLLNLKNYEPLFVPINKYGSQAKESVKIIEETYNSENQILIFPAGLVSRKQKGVIKDLVWQKSFITKSKKYKRNIIPIFIHGQNSKFFYRISSFRRFLGIKANIEMFYLVNEMFKKRNTIIEFNIGKQIPYTTFNNKFKSIEWANIVKEHIYKIKDDYNLNFNYSKNIN
jgi:1-acyl-sn-glycerol-3-phosphate acyltransferase